MTAVLLTAAALLFFLACTAETDEYRWNREEVETALDIFVTDLETYGLHSIVYEDRLQAYLEAYQDHFGTSLLIVTLNGTISAAPYVYRSVDSSSGYAVADMAALPTYDIDAQPWVKKMVETKGRFWTEPYFHEVSQQWVITRVAPVRDYRYPIIVAFLTTDLLAEEP